MENVVLLSIITPYYNRKEYIEELANVLIPQLNEKVEWIIIDDGTGDKFNFNSPYIKLFYLPVNSGTASVPRNTGLDNAKGKYITFIDSDDMVSKDYIETIFNSFSEDYDYCYYSWKSSYEEIIIKDEPPTWNCCVWNCIYKKDLIGNIRFNKELKVGEDYEFNQHVRKGVHKNIDKIIYIYNRDTPNSLTKGVE